MYKTRPLLGSASRSTLRAERASRRAAEEDDGFGHYYDNTNASQSFSRMPRTVSTPFPFFFSSPFSRYTNHPLHRLVLFSPRFCLLRVLFPRVPFSPFSARKLKGRPAFQPWPRIFFPARCPLFAWLFRNSTNLSRWMKLKWMA